MKPTEIEFACRLTPGDTMQVQVEDDDPVDKAAPYGFRISRGAQLVGSVYLSTEDARKLFSHLGVWLHTHNNA